MTSSESASGRSDELMPQGGAAMIQWGLSVRDYRYHATNAVDPPRSAFQARCGAPVLSPLRDEPPGAVCERCAAEQYGDASPTLLRRSTQLIHLPEAALRRLADVVARAARGHQT